MRVYGTDMARDERITDSIQTGPRTAAVDT